MEIILNPTPDTWEALAERNIPDDAAIAQAMQHYVAMRSNLTEHNSRPWN